MARRMDLGDKKTGEYCYARCLDETLLDHLHTTKSAGGREELSVTGAITTAHLVSDVAVLVGPHHVARQKMELIASRRAIAEDVLVRPEFAVSRFLVCMSN